MRRTVKSKLRGRKTVPFLGGLYLLLGRKGLLYGGSAALLLLISLTHIQTVDTFRMQVWGSLSPVLSVISQPFIATASFVTNISSYQTLQADSALLEIENERLMEWYHTAQLLKAENQSLKSLLNVQSSPTQFFITARILVDPATPYVQSILLDAGTQNGVDLGQAVITGQGLLGRVVEVQESLSRALLLTDINSRIPIIVEGTNQKGIIIGRNLKKPLLEYIPEDVTLEAGMRLLTSGDGGMLPSGLPIGYIHSIHGNVITIELLSHSKNVHFARILGVQDK